MQKSRRGQRVARSERRKQSRGGFFPVGVVVAHQPAHQVFEVMPLFVFSPILWWDLVFHRVSRPRDHPLIIAVIEMLTVTLDEHAAHQPLPAKVNHGMTRIAAPASRRAVRLLIAVERGPC